MTARRLINTRGFEAIFKDASALKVFKAVQRRLKKRFGLNLSVLDEKGNLISDPKSEEPGGFQCICGLEDPACDRSICQSYLQGLAARLTGEGELPVEPVACRSVCPAHLVSQVRPVTMDGRFFCAVAAGGYSMGDPIEGQDLLSSEVPVIGSTDEHCILEMACMVCDELAVFKKEMDSRERRVVHGSSLARLLLPGLVGRSQVMQQVFRLVNKVSATDTTVLIQGENGTGKELLARAVHLNSLRSRMPFVVQDCSSLNDNLLNSELFGHKRGAFTGAIASKKGLFEMADGGTLFMDEVGDMSPTLQVKLLRVLQEGTFSPLGGIEVKKVDVRIIAATHRDLALMVGKGEFREDLFYRLNVIRIRVPSLRERKEDIPLLAEHFVKKQAKGSLMRTKRISRRCMDCLLSYDWPGNVRELENEIERTAVLAGNEAIIEEELLSSRIRQGSDPTRAFLMEAHVALPEATEALERSMIYASLCRNRWNKSKSARELKISRRNLIRKVTRYQLDRRRAR